MTERKHTREEVDGYLMDLVNVLEGRNVNPMRGRWWFVIRVLMLIADELWGESSAIKLEE